MKSQKPISSHTFPNGHTILRDATGKQIGTVDDPQDADTIVKAINALPRHGEFQSHP
jgi:hypothetical protein